MILSLSLKISGAVLVAVFATFIVIKNKKFLWPSIILAVGLSLWQGLAEYNRNKNDLLNSKADVKISAVDLVQEYEANDSVSNQKYLGKIVEVTGNIKEIKKNDKGNYVIFLGDTSSVSSVRCLMDSVHRQDAVKILIGSADIVRGICRGYFKNELQPGSDVILNRSVIIQRKH